MRTNILTCTHKERQLLIVLVVSLVVLIGSYIYFVNTAVHATLERKALDRDMLTLASEVSGLESEYMDAKNTITLEYAHALGYQESTQPLFVSRQQAQSLTLNNRVE